MTGLAQGALNAQNPVSGVRLLRSGRGRGYLGPAPPKGHGPHRYVFLLFALGKPLTVGSSDAALDSASCAMWWPLKVTSSGAVASTDSTNARNLSAAGDRNGNALRTPQSGGGALSLSVLLFGVEVRVSHELEASNFYEGTPDVVPEALGSELPTQERQHDLALVGRTEPCSASMAT
jgi:hypothetical protein